MESLAQVKIHEFESDIEAAYDAVKAELPPEVFEPLLESLSEDIVALRADSAPNTPDVTLAFLMCLTDQQENPDQTESANLKRCIQATLQWMRLNGKLQ